MRIGIIGAGNIGSVLARLWTEAGHEVLVSFSRDEQKLRRLAQELGSSARAGTPADAAGFGEVVVVSVPWPQLSSAIAAAGELTGKVVVDTTNPFASPGGRVDLPRGVYSAAQRLKQLAPGARLVKAFNTLYSVTLADSAGATDTGGQPWAIPLSGDDAGAVDLVSGLVRDAGYEPVPIGSLSGATRQEPGSPLYNELLTPGRVRSRLVDLKQVNQALGRRFVAEVLGAQDQESFKELVDEDVVNSGINPGRARLSGRCRQDGARLRRGLPSLHSYR